MVTITRRVFNVISSRTFHRARRRQLAGDSSTAPRSLHTSDSRRGRKKVLVPRVVSSGPSEPLMKDKQAVREVAR